MRYACDAVDHNGEDAAQSEPSERTLGMIFQSCALQLNMLVEEIHSFGLKNTRLPKDKKLWRIKHAKEDLHTERLLKR